MTFLPSLKQAWIPRPSGNRPCTTLVMRKLIFAGILLLALGFLFTRFAEMRDVINVFRSGNPLILLLALLTQICWFGVVGFSYHRLYAALDIHVRALTMTRLTTAASFVNVVAPSGGLSSIALFVSNARSQGIPSARVTVAALLYIWFEYLALLLFLLVALALLALRGRLEWTEIIAAVILFFAAAAMYLLFTISMRRADRLGFVFSRLLRIANRWSRFIRLKPLMPEERALEFAAELAGGFQILRSRPGALIVPLLLGIANKSMLAMILGYCFFAFSIPASPAVMLCGFSISCLFTVVSPTPAGLGVVEGVMPMALHSLGISLDAALVITLAYRGVTFWFPLLAGMLALRSMTLPPKRNLYVLSMLNKLWKHHLPAR